MLMLCVCADTTMTASTGSSKNSAPVETIARTWRIIPIPTTAPPTATTQTGRRSNEPQPAGPAPPETSAPPTTRGHQWATAHLSTIRRTTRVHRNKSGAAAKHNRSCLGLLVAAIDSTQQMPYRNCGLQPEAVRSTVQQSVQHGCHLLASAAAHLGKLGGKCHGGSSLKRRKKIK